MTISAQVDIEEAEFDEMWSFVYAKSQQYWLWWAIDHNTGILLYLTNPCSCSLSNKRFGEALQKVQESMDTKNIYAYNPAFDRRTR